MQPHTEETVCFTCGSEFIASGCGTGYGYDKDGHKHCYKCCADQDRAWMAEHKRIDLYLTKSDDGKMVVTNWPGTLRFRPSYVSQGHHNIAGVRWDVWFTDEQGNRWWGYQIGHWTEICHCKMLKGGARC